MDSIFTTFLSILKLKKHSKERILVAKNISILVPEFILI